MLVVPLTSAAAGCAGCDKKSCVQPGVYLYTGNLQVGDQVTTCVDDACHTAPVLAPESPPIDQLGTMVQNQFPLQANAKVRVSITIVGPNGTLVGQLIESRKVPSGASECACEAFTYQWTPAGKVARFTG
jgi:hypothetical protein